MHKEPGDKTNAVRAKRRYIAALAIFGTNGLLASAIDLASPEIVLWRTLLGCAVLAVCARALRPRLPRGRDLAFIAASGAAMGVSWAFQYEAYKTVGVGLSSLIYCLGPVLVMALAPVLLREKPSAAHVAGLVAVQMGAACAVSAAACVAGQVTGGLQLALPSAADMPVIAALGLANGGLCCYWYFDSINKLPAATVAVCDYLEPVSSLVLSAAFLGERLAAPQIFGATLILAGAVGSEVFSAYAAKQPRRNASVE